MLFFALSLVWFSNDCRNAQTAEMTNNKTETAPAKKTEHENVAASNKLPFSMKNPAGDLEYEIKIRRDQSNGAANQLIINYSIKNLGDQDYILFNRGDSTRTANARVYVEQSQPNGIVELSQKAFGKPKDVRCPASVAPILPRAQWLKAKQTIAEQVEIVLPLQIQTPFDYCYPKRETVAQASGYKFCLGTVPADSNKIKISPQQFVAAPYQELQKLIREQQLLCSDVFESK